MCELVQYIIQSIWSLLLFMLYNQAVFLLAYINTGYGCGTCAPLFPGLPCFSFFGLHWQ